MSNALDISKVTTTVFSGRRFQLRLLLIKSSRISSSEVEEWMILSVDSQVLGDYL